TPSRRAQISPSRPCDSTGPPSAPIFPAPPSSRTSATSPRRWTGWCPGRVGIAVNDVERKKVEEGVRLILEGIGDDPEREGVRDTPRRVAEMYEEIFSGVGVDPTPVASIGSGADCAEMMRVKDSPLQSVCEHNLLPFNDKAHVAHTPHKGGRIT